MWLCNLVGFYYTLRFGLPELSKGIVMQGHRFEYTGEVYNDRWVMECARCSVRAAIDIAPDR